VGATAIALEMSWTRLLATWLGSSTYSFTVVLATFLAGIAVGSYIFERWIARSAKITLAAFAKTQFATAAAALLFLLFCREMPALVVSILSDHHSFVGLVLAQFFASAFTMLPAAIAFGFNFPLVTLLVARADADKRPEQIASSTGRAYAVNTSGAVVAAIVTGFFLLPGVGSFRVVAGTAVVSVLLALFLAVHRRSRLRRRPAGSTTEADGAREFVTSPGSDAGVHRRSASRDWLLYLVSAFLQPSTGVFRRGAVRQLSWVSADCRRIGGHGRCCVCRRRHQRDDRGCALRRLRGTQNQRQG
jgi:hypothetical protein